MHEATEVAIATTTKFLENNDTVSPSEAGGPDATQIEQVVFCVFSAEDEDVYRKLVRGLVPGVEDA